MMLKEFIKGIIYPYKLGHVIAVNIIKDSVYITSFKKLENIIEYLFIINWCMLIACIESLYQLFGKTLLFKEVVNQ